MGIDLGNFVWPVGLVHFNHRFWFSLGICLSHAILKSQTFLNLHIETKYIFTEDRIQKSLSTTNQIKKINAERSYKI